MAPIYGQIPSFLIIFKPGYASLEIRADKFDGRELKEEEVANWYWAKDLKYRIHGHGTIEIPRLRAREERINALRGTLPGPDVPSHKMKLLMKIYNQEEISLGLQPTQLP